jgi:hypothetical protein
MTSVRANVAVVAIVGAVALGCPPGDGTGLDEFGNPMGPGTGGDSVTFTAHVQPIFTQNCAFAGGCHAGTSPAQGMNLAAGSAHSNIVNVPALELPSMNRVEPDQPDQSYLVHKVQGTQATVGGSGDRMPLGGNPLSAEQIGRIRVWISLGAKNN